MRPRLLPSGLLILLLDITANAYSSLATTSHANDRSFLGDALVRDDPVQKVLDYEPTRVPPTCPQPPTGPIETTLCDYETIESVNGELFSHLHALVQMPFFRYFRVDLYRDCPFWEENILCKNEECRIVTVDESEIPENWRAALLIGIEQPPEENRAQTPGCFYRDSDFCFLDDMTEGDYVDLHSNPERYTGYVGPSAHRIWEAIYRENCFGESEFTLMNEPQKAAVSLPDTLTEPMRTDKNSDIHDNEQCLEKRVYYKVISGLHASISTHICLEMPNKTTGEWGANLQCFVNRVASHPERLQYIYFNTVLLLRAVARIGPYLSAYDYCATGTDNELQTTLGMVQRVVDIATQAGKFDESVLFRGANAAVLKEEFKQHFRNVTRIMDCVGCDKCRLWGKVQTTGLATALKILFEMDEKALDPVSNSNLLSRQEVVALMNTLHRFTESLQATDLFRHMWRKASVSEAESLKRGAEDTLRDPQPSPVAGENHPPAANIIEELIQMCKDGTKGCVVLILGVIDTIVSTVASLFRLSGKENGPHMEL